MSELQPNLIPLDKGLSLQVAPIAAPVGSIASTLNYEQVDFQGQKRIDGFTRYNGYQNADLLEYKVLVVDDFSGAFSPIPGDVIFTDAGLYAIVLATGTHDTGDSSVAMHIVEVNTLNAPILGTVDTQAGQTFTELYPGVDEVDITPQQYYENLAHYNELLRQEVGGLAGPIAGLHWFRDRLYAVASLSVITLSGTSPTIYPTDSITNDATGNQYTVLRSVIGTTTRLVFVAEQVKEGDVSAGDTFSNTDTSDPLGTVLEGFEESLIDIDIASLYQAITLKQAGEAGNTVYGWSHIPTGWVVHFINGVSLFGKLTAINQHPDLSGNANSTSTDGTSGKPLVLTQNIDITNLPNQVNGWKTTTFPAVYSLEDEALDSVDDYAIYADAYVSWDGETGTVSAPGATDGVPLTEYAPTNSIEVEI